MSSGWMSTEGSCKKETHKLDNGEVHVQDWNQQLYRLLHCCSTGRKAPFLCHPPSCQAISILTLSFMNLKVIFGGVIKDAKFPRGWKVKEEKSP